MIHFLVKKINPGELNTLLTIHLPIHLHFAIKQKNLDAVRIFCKPEFGISLTGVGILVRPALQDADLFMNHAIQKQQDESAYSQIVEFLKNPHQRTESIPQNIVPSILTTTSTTQTSVTISSSSPTLSAVEYDNAAQSLEQKIKELETNMLQRLTIKILFSLASADYKIQKLEQKIKDLKDQEITPMLALQLTYLTQDAAVAEQINKFNAYQQAFYKTLQWELTGCYLSAIVVSNGIVAHNQTGKLGKAGHLVKIISGAVPAVGSLVKLIGTIMLYADQEQQKKAFERYEALGCNLKTVSDVIEEFARKTALNQEIRIERNKVGILGKMKEILSRSLECMVENFTEEDAKEIVSGSVLTPLSNAFLEYCSETLTQEQEKAKGKIDAKIIAALVNGKILSSNILASKTTTADKVNQLSEWVTDEFRAEEAHALTFERCMAESVLLHLKQDQKHWKEDKALEGSFVKAIKQKIINEHLLDDPSASWKTLKTTVAGCVISKKKFICCGPEISSLHSECVAMISRSAQEGVNITNAHQDQHLYPIGSQEIETDTHSLLGAHNDQHNPHSE